MIYKVIIGLEIHVQLNTKTKLFCSCLNEYSPQEPNQNICEFCTGQPGALPVLNQAAVLKALRLGVSLGSKIPEKTRWDRKNYFYPDLPTGYQISQYDNPIVQGGFLDFFVESEDGKNHSKSGVNLTRAHLEADAGKLLHMNDKTLVDYNRSGAPLIEIVTEPEIRSGAEAMAFVSELQLLVKALGISEASMEKGQMRFDCNLSLQNEEEFEQSKLPGYKVEIKNINSIRSLGRAVEYEIIRQTELLENGQIPDQETRGWKDDLNKSVSQRSKENAHDYRYFPEPDLQILEIKPEDIPLLEDLPKLPGQLRQEYLEKGLNLQIANTLITQPEVGRVFEATLTMVREKDSESDFIKSLANFVTGLLLAESVRTEKTISEILSPVQILDLVLLFSQKKISNQSLEKVLKILSGDQNMVVSEVVSKENLIQISDDSSLEVFVDLALKNNPKVVLEYQSGKVQVIGFLVGQSMKESGGRGNPQKFKELLEKKLS